MFWVATKRCGALEYVNLTHPQRNRAVHRLDAMTEFSRAFHTPVQGGEFFENHWVGRWSDLPLRVVANVPQGKSADVTELFLAYFFSSRKLGQPSSICAILADKLAYTQLEATDAIDRTFEQARHLLSQITAEEPPLKKAKCDTV